FDEDALRIFRAIRFGAQLGFSIDEETKAAIKTHAENLKKVSAERIQVELVKLLVSPNPMAFRQLYETGITSIFMPEFDVCMETPQNTPHHCYSVGEHILHAMPIVPPDKVLRLTMLFHDMGKPLVHRVDSKGTDHFKGHGEKSAELAKKIMKRLKFDNDTTNKVVKLVRYHDLRPTPASADVRRCIHTIGKDLFTDYLTVQFADNWAKSNFMRESKLSRIEGVNQEYIKILGRRDPLSLKELAIGGSDLLKMGIKGREVGDILESSLMMVLEDPALNDKEILLAYADNYHKQRSREA
ncbi:MAG: HD domain-containing protein, partial [Lachnospiraceae bacterium]|nr:HD domain-containing protein [Candidatus Equihabitans merdae]